jgi:hypothetical protein
MSRVAQVWGKVQNSPSMGDSVVCAAAFGTSMKERSLW